MPLYEHVFIARQDISGAQIETLIEEFSTIITDNGGAVVNHEYWGLRPMAYKINKNRKGHYAFLRLDAPAAAIDELQRIQRIHEDVMRTQSFSVDEHEEGPSAIMLSKNSRDERRGSRDRDRGPREDRPPRDDAAPAAAATTAPATETPTAPAAASADEPAKAETSAPSGE